MPEPAAVIAAWLTTPMPVTCETVERLTGESVECCSSCMWDSFFDDENGTDYFEPPCCEHKKLAGKHGIPLYLSHEEVEARMKTKEVEGAL